MTNIGLDERAAAEVGWQFRRLRLRARKQRVQILEDLVDLACDAARMLGGVTDDAGRAGDHQCVCRHEHRAGKGGRSLAVLPWIAIRRGLPRILERDTRSTPG